MQPCRWPHKPFIFRWNLVPATDPSTSCTSITQRGRQGPPNKPPRYRHLPPGTLGQRGFYISFLLPCLLRALTQSPPKQPHNRWVQLDRSWMELCKQAIPHAENKAWSPNTRAVKAHSWLLTQEQAGQARARAAKRSWSTGPDQESLSQQQS